MTSDRDVQAAYTIQAKWRAVKLRRRLYEDFHSTYCALSHVDFAEASHRTNLSFIMLGQRQARCDADPFCKKNPYLNDAEPYFRFTQLKNGFRDNAYYGKILKSIGSSPYYPKENECSIETPLYTFPIDSYATTSVDELIDSYCSDIKPVFNFKPFVRVVRSSRSDLLVCYIRRGLFPLKIQGQLQRVEDDFFQFLASSGVLLSPWRLFYHVQPTQSLILPNKIFLLPTWPQTQACLLESPLFQSFCQSLDTMTRFPHVRAPTYQLMRALKALILATPELNPAATQRIACMLDIAHHFYRQNYFRYSQYVYAIVHEISLEILAQQDDAALLEKQFNQFLAHSKKTLHTLLSLKTLPEENTPAWDVISILANSGSHAYSIAINLAEKANTGQNNKIFIAEPFYFEIGTLSNNHYTEYKAKANIHVISTGCDLMQKGDRMVQVSGVDLNHYIEQFCQEKDSIILVDMSTALYDTLCLSDLAQQLIRQGKLSIIIFESFQKFGLLHTDQAQAGRVLALCSKKHFKNEDLEVLQNNGRVDFNQKIDLRIAHFINMSCHDVLNDIRKQHYKNAHFIQNQLASSDVMIENNSKEDKNKLFFIIFPHRLRSVLDVLSSANLLAWVISSGKAISNISTVFNIFRFSAHASDEIDSRILIAYLFLAYRAEQSIWHFTAKETSPEQSNNHLIGNENELDEPKKNQVGQDFAVLFNLNKMQLKQWLFDTVFKSKGNLPLQQQILLITVAHFFIFQKDVFKDKEEKSLFFLLIPCILDTCFAIKGRDIFTQIEKEYYLVNAKRSKETIDSHLLVLNRFLLERSAKPDWYPNESPKKNGLDLLNDTYDLFEHKNLSMDNKSTFSVVFYWNEMQLKQWALDTIFKSKGHLSFQQQMILIAVIESFIAHEDEFEIPKRKSSLFFIIPFLLEKCPLLQKSNRFIQLTEMYHKLNFRAVFDLDKVQLEQLIYDTVFQSRDSISLQQQIFLITAAHFFLLFEDTFENASSFFLVLPSVLDKCFLLKGTALFLQIEKSYHRLRVTHVSDEIDHQILTLNFILTYRSKSPHWYYLPISSLCDDFSLFNTRDDVHKKIDDWSQLNFRQNTDFQLNFKPNKQELEQWVRDSVAQKNLIMPRQQQIFLMTVVHFFMNESTFNPLTYKLSIFSVLSDVLDKCFLLRERKLFLQIKETHHIVMNEVAKEEELSRQRNQRDEERLTLEASGHSVARAHVEQDALNNASLSSAYRRVFSSYAFFQSDCAREESSTLTLGTGYYSE